MKVVALKGSPGVLNNTPKYLIMNIQAGSKWVEAICSTAATHRFALVRNRPIIAWFSEKEKAIRRLTKLPGGLGSDWWMVHGRDDGSEFGSEVHTKSAPAPLHVVLRTLTPENGWVIYEFKNEIDFYKAALNYLQG